MKKLLGVLLTSVSFFAISSCGCSSPKSYNVNWDLNYAGAPTMASVSVLEGTAVSKPSDPTRDHYVFKDWFTEAECKTEYDFSLLVSADLTIYAGWTAQRTVAWNLNYDGAPALEASVVGDGETLNKPTDPTREGYTFKARCTEAAGTNEYDFTSPVTSDFTLFAKWEADIPYAQFTMAPAKNNSRAGDTLNVEGETKIEVTPDEGSSEKRNAQIGIQVLKTNCPAQFGTSANDYWLKTKKAATAANIVLTISAYNFVASPYGGIVWMKIDYTLSAGETGKPFYSVNYVEHDYESGAEYASANANGISILRINFSHCTKDVFINKVTFKVIVPNT